MKISAELIQGANQSINAIKDRELDLRGNSFLQVGVKYLIVIKGYKIPLIENMGATLVKNFPFC